MTDYGCSKHISKKDPRQEKWKKQRKERGFDDTETWSLDQTFAAFLIPRLKVFKERTAGYPACLTMEEWDKILQEMIEGFEEILEKDRLPFSHKFKKANKGLRLFTKWYFALWW